MTGRKKRAERGRAWAQEWAERQNTCPNCGRKGLHYAPAGFGCPGTFVCNKPTDNREPFIACAVDGDGRPMDLPPDLAASILDAVKRKFEHDHPGEAIPTREGEDDL